MERGVGEEQGLIMERGVVTEQGVGEGLQELSHGPREGTLFLPTADNKCIN